MSVVEVDVNTVTTVRLNDFGYNISKSSEREHSTSNLAC